VTSRIARALLVLALAALLAACAPASSSTLRSAGAAPVLLGAHNDDSTPFNLVSLPALIHHRYDGRGLRLGKVLARELAWIRYSVSYRSGPLRITGVMNVPTRPGRHPLVVIAHGWRNPVLYTSGTMLEREQAVLAESGFVVFQIDYRNYAGSTRETARQVARPLGYPEDLINAVRAVKRARLPFVDTSRVGLFGRSMGGGVVLNALAARPHLAQAAVLYSPVSSLAANNYERWVRRDRPLRKRVVAAYGTPASRPAFWRAASSRTYLDRIAVPLQIDHGTADRMCPLRWSVATTAALRADGKNVTLYEYPGERHRFDRSWPLFMHRAVRFLRAHLE
jgi:dipeptidyl aminopeptidase/acylaminoacyl peptidase